MERSHRDDRIRVVSMTSYRVLVPIDGNEDRSQRQAEHVLSMPNAAETLDVTLLHVYPTIEGGDAGTERVGDQMGQPDSIDTVRQMLSDNGIAVETREREGDVGDTILAVAREIGPDIIVMAGRKRSPVGKAIFGSVTQTVILNADFPVTVVN